MRLVLASSLVFLMAAIFVFLSPELKNVSRETLAAETPTNAEVSEGLTCQCGCGLTVANCNMPTCGFSVPMRRDIDRMIGEGKTRAQIISFYRAQYGEKVLSAPTTEGFNILAWLMPFAALALGGAFIVYTTNRWRSAPAPDKDQPAPPAKKASSQFDAALRRRLEDEIRERS